MEIPEFFCNRNIFITGATGFLGKVLLEKILRTCEVRKVYLLLRSKKDVNIEERKSNLLRSDIFSTLNKENPYSLHKVFGVEGNMTEENLGMSQENLTMVTKNVSVVFHVAASVKFMEPFHTSFENNVESTKQLCEVCRSMNNLLAYVHVSTAYSNCQKKEVEEKVYPVAPNYEACKIMFKLLDVNFIENIIPKLLNERPNVYTLTKAIAEDLLNTTYKDLPVVIIRPSIITSTWKEPFPGWNDSNTAFTGVVASGMKGILRSFLCYGDKIGDLIPADVVVNSMLAAAWNKAQETHISSEDISVYNCTSGAANPINLDFAFGRLAKQQMRYPLLKTFMCPNMKYTKYYYWNRICHLIRHYLPAASTDFLLIVSGKKSMFVTTYKKLHHSLKVMLYFSIRDWKFHYNNLMKIQEKMSYSDRQKFNFDITSLDWEKYFENFVIGLRRYLFKEEDSTLQEARNRVKRLYFIGLTAKVTIFLGLLSLLLLIIL